jgi:hypothetical protein
MDEYRDKQLNDYLDYETSDTMYCDHCEKDIEAPEVEDAQYRFCSETCYSDWLGYDDEGLLIEEKT